MSILILGSSLAACTLGFNWPSQLDKKYKVNNYGINGAQVPAVIAQLKSDTIIPKSFVPKAIVLIVGGNDFSTAQPEFKKSAGYEKMKKGREGLPEASIQQFRIEFGDLLTLIKTRFESLPVCVINIKPASENIEKSELNRGIQEYNKIIEQLTNKEELVYADLFTKLIELLATNPDKTAKSDDINHVVNGGRMVSSFIKSKATFGFCSQDSIGNANGFYITCDGSHFNERSGKVVVSLVNDFLITIK
jgi:lysophospholipase L1-like esterase